MKQLVPAELVEGLSTFFPRSNAAATAWGNMVSNFLLLRRLRAYWPFTSVDENGDVYDLCGQGRVLTFVPGLGAQTFTSASLLTYAAPAFASGQYYYRPDEAGLDITGAITVGGWFYHNNFTTGANQSLISKFTAAGNQRSYMLYMDNAATVWRFYVSSTGANSFIVNSSIARFSGRWFFAVGRYNPSTSVDIFLNGTIDQNLVGIPAALFNSNTQLQLAASNAGTQLLDGRLAHCFICADYLEDYFLKALYWHSCPLFGVKP